MFKKNKFKKNKKVYLVELSDLLENELIGVFSTKEKAKLELERIKSNYNFYKCTTSGFYITEIVLDNNYASSKDAILIDWVPFIKIKKGETK